MSEVRQWTGFAPDLGAGVSYCPKCRCPVVNTEVARQEHENRVHRERVILIRLPTTHPLPKELRQRRMGEEDSILCEACRNEDHLICDGGECRCVCALELDEPKRNLKK